MFRRHTKHTSATLLLTILLLTPTIAQAQTTTGPAWRECVPNSIGPGGCDSIGPGGGKSIGPGGGLSIGPEGGLSIGPGGGQSIGPGGGQSIGSFVLSKKNRLAFFKFN